MSEFEHKHMNTREGEESARDARLAVNFAGLTFANPITVASGTFGSGMEYADYCDLSLLGAVTTKGVSDVPWEGNPTPRLAETPSGMLNAIGLQNPGIEVFCERDLPFLKEQGARIIVNVCGHTEEEYLRVVERLAKEDVDLLEINISCPNVKAGGITFGTDPDAVYAMTKSIKAIAAQPVVMKLSPNVTSMAQMALAAQEGGADGISLINTITGMKIDTVRRKLLLANGTGGLSGPAIHPVAVRMVYEAAHAVSIPIIGMGGVSDVTSALEMLMAGATMVAVGTANFVDPYVTQKIISGLSTYLDENGFESIEQIIGIV